MRKLQQGVNDLASQRPDLAKEWDYDANGKGPECFHVYSNKQVTWICPKCDFHYPQSVNNRSHGRNCPCCSGKQVVPGKNDLATVNPSLAAEWDMEKNAPLTPQMVTAGSGKRVQWRCPENHSYPATVLHRSQGTNCPKCNSGRQTSFAEQAVYFYIKKLYPDAINRYTADFLGRMELDIYIPSIKYAIEYDGIAWHKKDKLERERRKYKLCHDNNIKVIRLRETKIEMCLDNADYTFGREKLYEPKELCQVIDQLLDFLCFGRFGHPIDIDLNRDRPEIYKYATKVKGDSLESAYPQIAKEWLTVKNGTLTPVMVKPHSDIEVWWKCPQCFHEYPASVGHRTAGTGCPKCAIQKVAGANKLRVDMIDLETNTVLRTYPSITEAGRDININSSNITSVCKGKRKKAGGYGWQYHIDNQSIPSAVKNENE